MSYVMNWKPDILDFSTQINDGMTQTSGDGINMVFDSKYGIMFCFYMPGMQGSYGESRGRVCLTYFPASQPANSKTIEIASGRAEYVPQIVSLGDGKVRMLYEINSKSAGDHEIRYRDFDFLTKELTEEKTVMLRQENGSIVPLTQSRQNFYLEERGFRNHQFRQTEQINLGGHQPFRGEDGLLYGAISTYLSEVILYRSHDDLATVEFFAVCPHVTQYEFDYKYLNGKIHAIFRTDRDVDAISYTTSDDDGKTWSEPVHLKDSIQCRPRIVIHNGHVLLAYNYFNGDCGNRPLVQQGRTSVRMLFGENGDPNTNTVVADLYSKCGIVNICLTDILGELYFAYSTSMLALEYHNGNPRVRGKDALRYVRLGDLTPEQYQTHNVVADRAMGKNAQ